MYSLGSLANKNLVTFPNGDSRSLEVCCNDRNLLNCLSAEVNPQLLLDKEDISILDIDLAFHSTVEPNGFVYKNSAGDEAVITYNQNTANMFGSFKTNKSYAIEKCHHEHIWKEFNITSFGPDIALTTEEPDIPRLKKLVDAGEADTTTPVSYSIMVYVTI